MTNTQNALHGLLHHLSPYECEKPIRQNGHDNELSHVREERFL